MRAALLLLALACAPARALDWSGTWDVTGSGPRGAYAGSATVERLPGGDYRVTRLVRLATPLPDGRTLAVSWHGVGRDGPAGLTVDVSLRQVDFVAEHAGLSRTPAQRAPLVQRVTLVERSLGPAGGPLAPTSPAPVGTRLEGLLLDAPTPPYSHDVWVKTARADAPHPGVERRLDPLPITVPKSLFFALFSSYHGLPAIAPSAAHPQFLSGVHLQRVDTTGRDYTRANPGHVLVVQKALDDIAVLEDTLRADAFRWRLHEKARGFDADMVRDHIEAATGMLGGKHTGTGEHVVHGDSALHQGVWVASQAYRWDATGDPQALANVESGLRAIIAMVDAPGRPDEFGRAVQVDAFAPANWARSTALPGIAYLQGGNNDMMHGVKYGLGQADRVLPAGHPLRAEIGRCATSLLLHHRVGDRVKHKLVLGDLAARLTGDPAARDRYRRAVTWSPLDRIYLLMGEGVTWLQEVNGRSGPHLATCTFASLRHLGGPSPSLLERSWRWLADAGMRRAFDGSRGHRPGNLAAVAASAGASGAADVARDALAEVPYPRISGASRIDHEVDADFLYSPYPALPWKFDWMTNPGRQQALVSYPLWELGDSDNYWKEGPFASFRGHQNAIRWSSQDWLHAYWFARHVGALSAAD